MLARTLEAMIEQKWTTAREIGELTGVAPSTVYRWISGESEPDFNSIRILLRHLPDLRAQQAIVSLFLGGTLWTATRAAAGPELDADRDGTISSDDALDAAIQAVRDSGAALDHVHDSLQDGRLTPEESVSATASVDEVIRQCQRLKAVLSVLTEDRKRARPTPRPE